jgi:hypothetical protein
MIDVDLAQVALNNVRLALHVYLNPKPTPVIEVPSLEDAITSLEKAITAREDDNGFLPPEVDTRALNVLAISAGLIAKDFIDAPLDPAIKASGLRTLLETVIQAICEFQNYPPLPLEGEG